MLEETGTVVEIKGNSLWVETQSRSSCSHCSTSSCSTSVLAKLFSIKRNRVELDNTLGAEVGQQVVIGISDDLMVKASLLSYLVPLLVMLAVVALADGMGMTDGMQILMAMTGLWLGFVIVRLLTNTLYAQQRFKPQLLRVGVASVVDLRELSLAPTRGSDVGASDSSRSDAPQNRI